MSTKRKSKPKSEPAAPCLPVENRLNYGSDIDTEGAASALEGFVLRDEVEFLDFALSNYKLKRQEARQIVLKQARLKQLRLSDSILPKIQVVDACIDGCDISNSDCSELRLSRVELRNSKFTGLKALRGKISDFLVEDCLGQLAEFYGCKFQSSRFANCKLAGADFRACDLSSTVFLNCDLNGVEFYEANLAGTEFRNSDLSGIKVHPADLKGAIIDAEQALNLAGFFAKLLEIKIV